MICHPYCKRPVQMPNTWQFTKCYVRRNMCQYMQLPCEGVTSTFHKLYKLDSVLVRYLLDIFVRLMQQECLARLNGLRVGAFRSRTSVPKPTKENPHHGQKTYTVKHHTHPYNEYVYIYKYVNINIYTCIYMCAGRMYITCSIYTYQ